MTLMKGPIEDKMTLINTDNSKLTEIVSRSRKLELLNSKSSGLKAQIFSGNPYLGFSIAVIESGEKGAKLGLWELQKNK